MDFPRVRMLSMFLLIFPLTEISLSQTDTLEQPHGSREKLLVLPFEVQGLSDSDVSLLTTRFSDGLKESNRFDISLNVPSQRFETAVDPRSLAQTGNTLGVQKVVHVNVVRRDKLYVLQIRLVNVSNASLLYAERVDFNGEFASLLTNVIPEQARKLSKAHLDAQTPWAKAAFLFGGCLGAILWILRYFRRSKIKQASL
jgi:TolB-like protein